MRLLVLSCNTGGGHNSAASAIRTHFMHRGIDCDVFDALAFVSKFHSWVFSKGHSFIYRHMPRLFGVGYRFEEKHPPRFLYRQMALGAKKIYDFLSENAYDAVVCTHIFGNMLMTEVRRKFGVTIPHYVVTTDYTIHPGTDMVDASRYFIAAESLRQLFLDVGIPDGRIIASGIPVSPDFIAVKDKAVARKRLGLSNSDKIILLFSGSIGCGKLNRIAAQLEGCLPQDCMLIVLCGHNERMHRRMRRRCGSRTIVLGYTDHVAEYMAAADLCIAKPGGLSTTEMLAMKLPMILLHTVPGCESRNLDFFRSRGVAIGTDRWTEAVQMTLDCIGDERRLAEMRDRLAAVDYPGGAKVVADVVLADIDNGKETL